MVLLDLLGRRWALRVMWELHQESLGFRELQSRCDGMSASVLSQRLGELREERIVELDGDGRYRLTARGRSLGRILLALNKWADRWIGR
jgi:DNA-binding HxlR family transcriptional regulator